MFQAKRRFMTHAAKVLDLCLLVASFTLTTLFVYSSNFLYPAYKQITLSGFLAMRIKLGNLLLFALLLFAWHKIFALCGVYKSKRLTGMWSEVMETCKATALASLFLFLMAKAFHIWMAKPLFVLLFWGCCTVLMIGSRVAIRPFLGALRRRGRNNRRMLIIGTNARAVEFARRIAGSPELGYTVAGFVDDKWGGSADFLACGFNCCCNFDGLAEYLRHHVVDEAAMYLPLRSYYEHASRLVSLFEQHGIGVRFDSQIFDLRNSQSRQRDFDDESLSLTFTRVDGVWHSALKRIMDAVLSAALLVLLSPLFLLVAFLIKFTSPGPVFFKQTRIGLNKRRFSMYKFRTMIANAERLQEQLLSLNEMNGPVFKIKNDPRVTPLGRVLRRTSIDELPQLFNVLKGDMSLVGPRAMSLRDYQLFNQDWQRRRFSVKPGITCLWQVMGRNNIPFEQWMELDMQYVDEWSLWLDCKILARTIPAVVRGSGAA